MCRLNIARRVIRVRGGSRRRTTGLGFGRQAHFRLPDGPGKDLAITASGRIVWYVEGNANPNMLVRFDPATEKFQTWPILPSGGGVVRHMVVGPDGSLWLADSEVDAITRVEIKAATGTR